MTVLRILLSFFLSLPALALAQGVTPIHPVKPNGVALFPTPFASADNIATQTATFMHGGLMAWDGASWDRLSLTAGALHVSVQNATLAVTQSGTWNIGSITTLPALPAGANTIGGVNLSQYTPSSGRLPVEVLFPTLPTTSAIAIRCVNTAGNAFEACGGTGGGGGGTSSNFAAAFPAAGTAAGFTDGTNMVAGRVVTTAPGASDAGLVVRNINPNLAADNSANSSNKTPVLPCRATAAAPSWTEGNQVPCSTTLGGDLRVSGSFSTDGIIRDGTGDTTQANVSTGRLHVDGSSVTQPVSAASLPLPTGAATAALQDGIVRDGTGDTTQANVSSGRLHVDANLPTTASTSSVSIRCVNTAGNAFEACGGAGGGGGTSSTYGAAFPSTGTAAGFTDGTNMVAGRVVTSAPASGDAGLVVRNINPNLAADNSANGTSKNPVLPARANAAMPTWTEGNQVPLSTDLSGNLRVSGSFSTDGIIKDGTGDTTQANVSTGRLHVDGSGVTQPVSAASLPLPTGAATAALQDGIIRDGTGDTTQANVVGGRLQTDGSGVTQPVTGTVTIGTALPAGTNNIGDVDVLTLPPLPAGTNNIGDVDVLTLPSIPAGNNNIGDVDIATMPAVTQATAANLNAQVVGSVAHDAVDAGNPVKIGCQARTTNRTAVADADRADCVADKNGQIVMTPMAPRERVVRSGVITLSTTTETTLVAAGGVGVFRDLTYLKCTNNSATLTRVDLRDATAGTVIDSWALAASGGGFNIPFSVPYAQATANNNWTVQLSGAVTDVRCSAQAVEKN